MRAALATDGGTEKRTPRPSKLSLPPDIIR
jgi:hypothetical protein